MPNFNKAIFLAETFNSVLKQTLTDWEIILVDDGSTDDSRDIIANFAAKDKRIKPVYREKQLNGGSICRNIGIEKALGEFIMFLDSDDLLVPACLEKRVKILENNKQLDFAVFPMSSFLKKVGDLDYIWNPVTEKALERFLSHELPWAICQPIFKTSFIKENGYKFDESFSRLQDVEFHTSILLTRPCFEVVHTPSDCFYRVAPARKTTNELVFYTNYSNSVKLYYRKFSSKSCTALQLSYLNLTVLNALYELFIGRVSKKISLDDQKKISKELLKSCNVSNSVISFYCYCLLKLNYNISGLRFLFKKVLLQVSN